MPIYKDEKRKTWYVKTRYTDWQGRRKETTKRGFATKREAKEWEENFHHEAGNSVDMTMESLCKIYLMDAEKRLKEQSVYSARKVIRNYIIPTLGILKVSEITPATIRQWQNHIIAKGFSPHTQRNINGRLSTILNFAVRYYSLPSNPMHIAGNIGRLCTREGFWEQEQFERFLSSIEQKDADYRLFFSVLYASGIRLGEFLALSPSDFDFEKNRLTISKNLTPKKNITTPKTDSSHRTISMPASIMQAVKEYLSRFYDTPEAAFATSPYKLEKRFKEYTKKAGLPHIPLHGIRHSHASYLIHKGVPITAISKRLGHKDPSITLKIYSHMYEGTDAGIAALIEKEMCGQNVVKELQ